MAFLKSSLPISSQARETIPHTYSNWFSLSFPPTKEEKKKVKGTQGEGRTKIYLLEISRSRCSLTCAVAWDGTDDTKIPFPLHELGSGWISCCFWCPLSHFSSHFDVRWLSKTVVLLVDKLVFSVNMFWGECFTFLVSEVLVAAFFLEAILVLQEQLLFSQHVPSNCYC